ncbi:MAG TPA: TonB-dependent receptor [Longimicrobiales bacterium]|nr:TonB-dependent receptor [Longimicrobiales bacterium]
MGLALIRRLAIAALLLAAAAVPAAAQGTGRVLGTVTDSATGQPLMGVTISLAGREQPRTITNDAGRFILTAVPLGLQDIEVEMVGYRTTTIGEVRVGSSRPVEVTISLVSTPIEVEGVLVEAERVRLIEPEVVASHEIVIGRELRELPVDRIEEAIELTPGVSDGHFRGGRVGQETYVVDGLALKNQLEGSTQGAALELAPSSLEEIEVMTGGFGAEHGSALSGVVSVVTRRGGSERWESSATVRSDAWAPESLFQGFTGLSMNAGGPVSLLGRGSTLFVDVLAQGMGDADPRARGLACVEPEDGDAALTAGIESLRASAERLYCPYSDASLPHQQGDKLIGFLRFDRPVTPALNLTGSLLYNRTQQELYTPELKYADEYRLGQRSQGALGQLAFDWSRHVMGRAVHLTARGAAMRLDRHLGVIDPEWREGHTSIAGVSLTPFEFLGEDFVHTPINEQLASALPVPGYVTPGGVLGSPFGPAAEGLFVTEGGSGIANWSRTEFVGGDLVGEMLHADGAMVRAGANTRFYRVQTYERVQGWLPGSSLNYALFFPATVSGFGEYRMIVAEEFQVQFGMRLEMFRSGIGVSRDPDNYLAPVADTEWKWSLMPRIGFAGAIPGSDGRASFKLSYGRVAQPPDFRFFLDTTIGDSLRTDIRRQGNPNLGFEEGRSYEVGGSYLVTPSIGVTVTAFRKELLRLVSGGIRFEGAEEGTFSTGDHGEVMGIEVSTRARWQSLALRLGYALQKAEGVTSGVFGGDTAVDNDQSITFPLAFDRRHAFDASAFYGQAAGDKESPWSAGITSTVHSGYPFDLRAAAGESAAHATYLPWTAVLDLRASRDIGSFACTSCRWRVTFDARNLLGRENVIALRRDNASLAPSAAALDSIADAVVITEGIPRESPRYSAHADLDGDGVISAAEFRTARWAAALDRSDPSLFFGEPRQVRIGLEVNF